MSYTLHDVLEQYGYEGVVTAVSNEYTPLGQKITGDHDDMLSIFCAVIHMMVIVEADMGHVKHLVGQVLLYGYEVGSESPPIDGELWEM